MNDREKKLSLALDALVKLDESLVEHVRMHPRYEEWQMFISQAQINIENAAMPQPSRIRQIFGRIKDAA